ncbi:MAG: hypothetical protein K0S61_108 [Anaerocolumna sp.]|jgi:hypothetical protein|nr:hypothetical protein [Anaerocolumna sp.]
MKVIKNLGGYIMNKNDIIGIGLIGVPFLMIGALIGGTIVEKQNKKVNNEVIGIWKDTAECFKELLLKECEKNEDLKKVIKLHTK